jgi:hypothetical protein
MQNTINEMPFDSEKFAATFVMTGFLSALQFNRNTMKKFLTDEELEKFYSRLAVYEKELEAVSNDAMVEITGNIIRSFVAEI